MRQGRVNVKINPEEFNRKIIPSSSLGCGIMGRLF